MCKTGVLITLILSLCIFCLSAPAGFAKGNKKPKIQWSQEKVNNSAERRESISIDVQFVSDGVLSNVSLWVVP